ncbi:MAG: thiol-disulfide oxidoreductase [Nitrospinae bacterium CG11_big_fil_rev_8_21_14_0_20_45_15]|nr:MAG: thiol-disulfide oxidoreductase [Nitrospinae bacterium CG11_big_fil_rev_8_21_14_0_20_45_15]
MQRILIVLSMILSLTATADVWANHALFEKLGVVPSRTIKEAPSFSLIDTHGKTKALKNFRGKPVLLHFWATWCAPCQEELPALQRLYEKMGGDQFEIVAVNIDRGDPAKVLEYIDKYKLTFLNLLDPEQTVRKQYFIRGLPTSYLIDTEGQLRGFVSGARTWAIKDSEQLFSMISARAN